MTTTNQRAVEEVAKVLALVQNGHPDYTPQPTADAFWGLLDDDQRERYRRMATAANKLTPGWRPISEAPRDGTRVLLANEHGCWMAEYQPVYVSGYRPENPWFSVMLNCDHIPLPGRYAKPTHFMPLPPPPGEVA